MKLPWTCTVSGRLERIQYGNRQERSYVLILACGSVLICAECRLMGTNKKRSFAVEVLAWDVLSLVWLHWHEPSIVCNAVTPFLCVLN
jgi:hypothetical protein